MDIIVEDVSKSINKTQVLSGINMELHSGKIYGFQGPNGCGKTMLMRLISGLIRPTIGTVYVNGKKLGIDLDFPDSMGLLIENPAFLPNYTGLKNLELLVNIRNIVSTNEIRTAIQRVGLNPDDRRTFRKFSLGMKQRLGIAAAIMESPELIILDEPFNALDEQGVEQIRHIIDAEKKRGALIIIACHDAQILESMADEIYSIHEGQISERTLCAN